MTHPKEDRMLSKKILAAALGVFFMTTQAGIAAKSDKKLIQKVLKESGAIQQVEQLPAIVAMLVQLQLGLFGTQQNEDIAGLIGEISTKYFVADKILSAVKSAIADDYNKKYLKSYLKWLRTGLGKDITELEVAASSPEMAQAAMGYAMQMEENPLGDERLYLVERMIEAINVEKHMARKTNTLFLQMIIGMNENMPESTRLSDKLVGKITDIYTQFMVDQTAASMLPIMLFTYDSLSDNELEKYVEFLESEEAMWLNEIFLVSQLDSVESDARNFGRSLGKIVAKAIPPERQKMEWEEYDIDDGTYSLAFPSEPESIEKEIPTDDKPIIMNIVSSQAGDIAFMLSWVKDYPPLMEKNFSIKEILTNSSMGAAANIGGQILDSRWIRKDNHFGIEYRVVFMGGAGLVRSQSYIVGKRLVQIMVTGPLIRVVSEDVQPFFDSVGIQ